MMITIGKRAAGQSDYSASKIETSNAITRISIKVIEQSTGKN